MENEKWKMENYFKNKKTYKFLIIIALFFVACSPDVVENSENAIEKLPRPRVSITTQYGEMVFELFNETPLHRDNFLKLVKEGFYDSLLIHRVQSNFMIQGGDPDSRGEVAPNQLLGSGGDDKRIAAEIMDKFVMRQGALCGFHNGVGHHPDKSSNAFQFMIIHGQPLKGYQLQDYSVKNGINYTPQQILLYEKYGGSPQLDGKYTIFGQLLEGVHVLDKIVQVKTHRDVTPGLPDRPLEDIRMIVKVLEEKKVVE